METTNMPPVSALEQINTLFDYSMWARDRLLGAIESLDDEALRRMPESGAYGSIHDTLAHMAVSEWMWVRRCLGDAPGRLPRGEDFASLRVLINWWNQIHSETVAYLADLNDSTLNEDVTYTGPNGKTRTRKVWHMLLQVVNHQTEHRSQLGTLLGQMSLEVLATDLVVYLSEQGSGNKGS
jgi:uncharacterized damage-inducible protein DinB